MSNPNLPPLPGPPRRLNRPASVPSAPAAEPVAAETPDVTAPAPVAETRPALPEFNQPAEPVVDPAEERIVRDETTPTLIAPVVADSVDADAPTKRNVFRKRTAEPVTASPFSTPVTGSTATVLPELDTPISEPHTPPGQPSVEQIVTQTKTSGPGLGERKKASRGFLIAMVILGAALLVGLLAWLAVSLFPSLLGADDDVALVQPPAVVETTPAEEETTPTEEEAPAAPVEETPAEEGDPAVVTPPAGEETSSEPATDPSAAPTAPEGELLQDAPSADTESDTAWDAAFAALDPAPTTITQDQGRWLASETCRQLEADTPADQLTSWLAGLAADTAEVGAVAEAGVATYCPAETPALLDAFNSVDTM